MSDLYAHRESDEYLLKPEHFAEKKNRPKRWDCLRPIIYTSLAFVGFIEILFFGIFFAQVTRKTPERLLGELNGLVGDFPARRVIFRSDPLAASDHKTEESRNATMNNWLSYMPRGNGFIAVNQTERYTLPPPIKQLGQDTYSIAVFHQLHCLVCHVLSRRRSLDMSFLVPNLQFSTQSCLSMTTWQQPNQQQI
ncbi:hypothetical protein AFCA_008559 [Aspergillus flavus]|nr:hypothetical protein AFCA_008559 [Aspergillus flavus]